MATRQITQGALLASVAVFAGSFGCDAPETGSLENAKNPKARPLDYGKLDYAKLDYSKLDYAKIDYKRLDPSKLDTGMLEKLGDKRLSALATEHIDLVSATNVNKELEKRLMGCRANAEKTGDKELIASLDRVLEAVKLNSSLINEDLRW